MAVISLCMIVKDEQEVIERCLESVYQLVDEIVIVDTGSNDNTIGLCTKYTSKIYHFEWCNDFAKARNFSFEKATSDYILWLDADDVIEPEQLNALLILKQNMVHDAYFLKYDYSQDEYGHSQCTFYRERIVKNDGTFRWEYPIHEVIAGTFERKVSYQNIIITHKRTTDGYNLDKGRNLTILSDAIQKEQYRLKPRMWYYYGRELFDHKQYIKALKAFTEFLDFKDTWIEDRVIAHHKIAKCYLELYHLQQSKTDQDNEIKAKEALWKAIKLDDRWAEPYGILGEIAYLAGDYDEAGLWYKKCLRSLPEVLSPVDYEVYGIRAYVNLVLCYDKLGDYKQSNYYNNLALDLKPNDKGLLYNREYLNSKINTVQPENKNKIAWYGNNPDPRVPTYRIRAIQINKALNKLGFTSVMVEAGEIPADFGTVIFYRSFSREDYRMMEQMRTSGKQVVLDLAEDLFAHTSDFPYYIPMIESAHKVICCSDKLAAKVALKNPDVYVVEDSAEPVERIAEVTDNDELIIGWVGMPENAHHAEKLRPLIESLGCRLVTIHTGNNCDKLWTLEGWQHDLTECDIAIAALDISIQSCKSSNKIIAYQSLGLPVIASPLDAYLEVIVSGTNGFIADTDEDWMHCINLFKDKKLREKFRKNGLISVMPFRIENITLKLARAILPDLYAENAVDIIIPTIYNTGHLSLCIDSIIACTRVPYTITIINSGSHNLNLPSWIKVIEENNLNFSAAVNEGLLQTNAPYVCIMNDDIIVTDGWLEPLLESIKNGIAICNPLSNCDKGFLHLYDFECEGSNLGAQTHILNNGRIKEKLTNTEFEPVLLHNYKPDLKPRQYTCEWVPFYCTLAKRETLNSVGLLDDSFNNGYEDVDYCRRAGKLQFQSGVNENSFVFHFGAISVSKFIEEQPEKHNKNQDIYIEKYKSPLMVIHAGYSYESWNGALLHKSGIGGSETAVIKMAESFCRLGYKVVVFCDCDGIEGLINGVAYYSLFKFRHFANCHFIDVFVLSRYANFLEEKVFTGSKYFWIHDVRAMGTQTGENDLLRKHIDELDGVFCLSPWHKDYVKQIHEIPDNKIIITGNGIDLNRFSGKKQTIPNRFIYSSSPDRSLDIVLCVFPKIKAKLPDATLHIYYGFDNWDKSIQQSGNAQQLEFRDMIWELMKQDGVHYHGRVDQDTLAEAFLISDIWLYPTQFSETYCITALEAQMSGTLSICPSLAGLAATVGDRGIIIEKSPSDETYDDYLANLVVSIQNDPQRKQEILTKAKQWAQNQSWDAIAGQWKELFSQSAIEVNNIGIEV